MDSIQVGFDISGHEDQLQFPAHFRVHPSYTEWPSKLWFTFQQRELKGGGGEVIACTEIESSYNVVKGGIVKAR